MCAHIFINQKGLKVATAQITHATVPDGLYYSQLTIHNLPNNRQKYRKIIQMFQTTNQFLNVIDQLRRKSRWLKISPAVRFSDYPHVAMASWLRGYPKPW